MAIINFLRKKFNVPDDKTLTEIQEPFDCWNDVIKLMNEYIKTIMTEHLMTLEEYRKYPTDNLIIRSGLITNSPTGCFMTRDEKLPFLRFVVVTRIEGMWTVYFGKPEQSMDDIHSHGDKSSNDLYIRRAFPCTDEVFKLYAS